MYLMLLQPFFPVSEAKLVEQYNDQAATYNIAFDEKFYFDKVRTPLISFAERFEQILTDENFRELYMKERSPSNSYSKPTYYAKNYKKKNF